VSKRRGLPTESHMRHDSHFVDSLSERFGPSLGRQIPIDEIITNPDQPRRSVGDLSELKASIESKGVLEPILVRPLEDGRFRIIAGERRFRAAMEAGLAEVPCIELDVPDNEMMEIALIENLHRRDLHAFEEAMGYGIEIAPGIGMDRGEVFGFFQQAFDVLDKTMVELARGHRTDPDVEPRSALVRGLLMGELPAEEINSGCVGFGIDPLASYAAFRAREPDGEHDDLVDLFGLVPEPGRPVGLAIRFESELIGFTSGDVPRGRLPLVAVGPCVPAVDLNVSYTVAGRVLAAAETYGLAGVQDLAGAGLHAAVIEDVELGQALGEALIEPVRTQASGEEILHTVSAWMAAGMRVEPAAQRLFIHANTVRYRLRRYEELTGTDLSVTDEAFRVWWAIHRDQAGAA